MQGEIYVTKQLHRPLRPADIEYLFGAALGLYFSEKNFCEFCYGGFDFAVRTDRKSVFFVGTSCLVFSATYYCPLFEVGNADGAVEFIIPITVLESLREELAGHGGQHEPGVHPQVESSGSPGALLPPGRQGLRS